MTDWQVVRLEDVLTLDVDAVPVTPTDSYDIFGVLNRGRGLLFRDPVRGDEISYKTLNRLRPNQIVYSRLKAFEGAITVAPSELGDVYASQEFPTFTCGDLLVPEFFALMTTTKQLWVQLQALSTGMGGRRERVKPSEFLTIEVGLPTVAEQKRIVDAIAGVDALVKAMADEIGRGQRALTAIRDDVLGHEAPVVPLSSITSKIGSGATPKGGENAYVTSGTSLIRSQNVYDGRFEWSGLAHINDEHAALLRGVTVESGDVLINITGASVNRLAIVPDAVLPARVNQHVAILRADRSRVLPAYLAHILRRSDLKRDLDSMAESGSTRQALTKEGLGRFAIPLPSLSTQSELVSALDTQVTALNLLAEELTSLRTFRSTLLTALLNQEIEIPQSYDAALKQVS